MFNWKRKKKKIGICFGGGGSRGYAHLGVLKAFEEYGIEFDAIAGCSVGSIIGALYASNYTFKDISKIAMNIEVKDIRNNKFGFWPSNNEGLVNFINKNIKYKKIEDLPKKLYIVACNLRNGEEIDFTEGDLATIISGSCAVPLLYSPVKYKNMTLIDGGVCNNIPANILKQNGCDIVISVDVNCQRGRGTKSEKMLDMILASMSIMGRNNSKLGYEHSDLMIKPDTKRFKSTKFDNVDVMVEEGYNATIAMMPKILELLPKKYRKTTLKEKSKKDKSNLDK